MEIELPDKIKFIDSQTLEDWYPDSTSKERERYAAEEFGAIFLKRINYRLSHKIVTCNYTIIRDFSQVQKSW